LTQFVDFDREAGRIQGIGGRPGRDGDSARGGAGVGEKTVGLSVKIVSFKTPSKGRTWRVKDREDNVRGRRGDGPRIAGNGQEVEACDECPEEWSPSIKVVGLTTPNQGRAKEDR
jgi:hypothetical protein